MAEAVRVKPKTNKSTKNKTSANQQKPQSSRDDIHSHSTPKVSSEQSKAKSENQQITSVAPENEQAPGCLEDSSKKDNDRHLSAESEDICTDGSAEDKWSVSGVVAPGDSLPDPNGCGDMAGPSLGTKQDEEVAHAKSKAEQSPVNSAAIRPQLLSTVLPSLFNSPQYISDTNSQQFQNVASPFDGESSQVSLPTDSIHTEKESEASSDTDSKEHFMIYNSTTRMLSPVPAVIEDPDTPMSRKTSQPHILTSDVLNQAPSIPKLVQEEKSPTLLAQEALAQSLLHYSNLISAQVDTTATSTLVTSKPKELSQTSQETCQPSPGNSTLTTSESTITTTDETSVKSSLYPVLQAGISMSQPRCSVGAMTLTELLSLYYNPELGYNETFVDEFIQKEIKRENHEFAEILLNYFRARHQFLSAEGDIQCLQKDYSSLQKELWITYKKSITVQGQCADQVRVSKSHSYEQCQMNADALAKINIVLEKIRKQIAENLSLFAYTAQMSRLQVESYIHDLYMSCPALRDVPKNADIQGRQHRLANEQHQIQRLKDCITILFSFHRKSTNDMEFITNIRQWTIRLVSSLLRLATFQDHLFILNHLLRCPAGVGKWAAQLIQFPRLPPAQSQHQSNFGGPILDHIITSLATVLLPAKGREEFMCHMRINLTEQNQQEDRAWILVDSDGEEDEDPANSWLYLHENDLVAFLGQFPLADVFSHVLILSVSNTGSTNYDIRHTTEPMMLHLFAFGTLLVQLLGAGLRTFNMARYRQLNKRLGRLIRQTVSFISDHWLNFKIYYGPLAPASSIRSLQTEFDQLFMRATYCILSAQKLGSWQFMADMPYTSISADSTWQLLWVLHQGQGQVVNLDELPPCETCKQYLQRPDSWQQLADNLMHMPASEAIYLLTTFANMASSRSSEEEQFIRTITLEVFEIAYLCNHTREICSKMGRELLSSIIQTHPEVLSSLLARVKEVIHKLGKMALYLFSDLPICIWQPADPDMLVLRQWLLNFELTSMENQLARKILTKMNWDVFEQTGRLVLDIRLHRQVALLLVEAYTRFISDKKAGFFIMEGMKQMASYITSSPSPEQVFNNWVWDLVLRLKLHQQSVLLHAFGVLDLDFQPPTMSTDTWLLPLFKGISNKTPIACFVAVAMTNLGHDITSFIAEGLDLLSALTSNYQYTTAIHLLGCVVPLFVDCPWYLLENVTFCQILGSLLAADESLFKSTKSAIMTVEFPGIVTRQLTEMIQVQVTSHLAHGKADSIIKFWLRAIFKVCKFFTEKNSCFVVDVLIRWSFVKKGVLDIITDVFKENYMKLCQTARSKPSLVTSVFQWMSSSNSLPSYMESSSLPNFPWLAYLILCVEGEQEVNTQLWQTLVQELQSSSRTSLDAAFKSVVAKLQLEQVPSLHRLAIYRWAQQALDTPHDHPLLPVFWQRFFALFLGRQVFESSMARRASVGEKFFESSQDVVMLRKMKKRLSETASYHLNFDPQKDAEKPQGRKSSSPGTPPGHDSAQMLEAPDANTSADEETSEYTSSREFHQMLAKLYQTYILWLEEPRLHDANLYLPALPPQYEAARLGQVFQGFMGPWVEFIDLEGVQYTLSCLAADWRKRLTCVKVSSLTTSRRNTQLEPENATERIVRRLKRFESPKSAPPIENIQSLVPVVSSNILDDKLILMQLVLADLDTLVTYAKIFADRMANHWALDNTYSELVADLYSNVTRTISITIECGSKVNPLHRCSGPAMIPIKLDVKQLNEMVQRRVDENRVEYKQVMIESLLPTALNICVAAVHTENIITLLIKQAQKSTDEARKNRIKDIACSLFYHMAQLVNSDTDFYPPAKQFLASCIEILGQEFVSRDALQGQTVLQMCLDKPSLAGLISPHFVPNNSPQQLVSMYGQLVHVLQPQNMQLVFMLLTKFDIRTWLTAYCPSEAIRKQFIEYLGSALMACGAEPESESKLVIALYLSHLAAVLESNFPSNLHVVMTMILQGSSLEKLHTKVWETLLRSCFTERSLLRSDSAGRERTQTVFETSEVEACVDSKLSTKEVKELLDWMSSFFLHARMSDPKILTFGLYSPWGRYVQYVSLLLGALARIYVTKLVKGSDDVSPYQTIALLWQPVVTAYSPWIQPLPAANNMMAEPWVEADDTIAVDMVSSFRKSVLYIYNQIKAKHPVNASGVLSLLLMYYMTGLCTKMAQSHVTAIYVSELKQLPWVDLRPDLQLLDTMIKIKEIASPCCFTLIGRLLPQIQWQSVMNFYLQQQQLDTLARMQTGLGVLLVQAHVDAKFSQEEDIRRLLNEALMFDWSLVTPEGYSCICSWFVQLCDPKCVLAERSSTLALGIRLLKEVAGFSSDTSWSEHVSLKRVAYIHCLTQQLCQLTYLPGTESSAVKTAIVNLLSDVEAVELSVPDVGHQEQESVNLLRDILSLLNNSNPEGAWLDLILSSLSDWLRASPQSLLVVPFMKAACHSLASLRQMSALVEVAIEAYFIGMDQSSIGLNGWPFILSVCKVPELNQAGYVQESLTESAFLALYTFLQHKLSACTSLEGELVIMENILDWSNRSQASEEDEAKLVLWWHLLLRLGSRQIQYGARSLVSCINILNRLTSHLVQLSQERMNKGILGVLGLGRKSPLSLKMRLLTRCLSAFLTCQIMGSDKLRSGGSPSPTSSQLITELRTLKKNKMYVQLMPVVDQAISFIQDPNRTIFDAELLLCLMAKELYYDRKYLCDILKQAQ